MDYDSFAPLMTHPLLYTPLTLPYRHAGFLYISQPSGYLVAPVLTWLLSHTGDEQGESDWYFRCEIITKSELGLQGTQMADLYTGMLLCLGQVAGELTGVYVAGSRVV